MRSPGFRRFVAVFVGVMVAIGWIMVIVTGEESLFGSVLVLTALFAIYLAVLVKKRREEPEPKQQKVDSPLLRR
jgi:Ca2+/Na+ antiporter